MHGNVPAVGETAISRHVTSDVEESSSVKSDAGSLDWFAEMAQGLLPTKPGTQLHYITGYDERLCQKYAAGSVKPSAFFLRVLLRSEQGAPFFAALMEGCTAQWWIDAKRAGSIGEQVLDLVKRS